MIEAHCHLESTSYYSQSKPVYSEKEPRENSKDYEERTWKERCHVNENESLGPLGNVFIPPMAFANSIKEAAKYSSIQIPGKGKSTYTKHFDAGVMVIDPIVTDTHIDDVVKELLFVPSDGITGSGKRVWKNFPVIVKWEGDLTYYIADPTITESVFKQILTVAGSLIGIGRFRPRNRGYYGRYKLTNMEWVHNG